MTAGIAALLMGLGVGVLSWLLWEAYPLLDLHASPEDRVLYEVALGLTAAMGVVTLVVCWLAWR